jgi:hypothetical protein
MSSSARAAILLSLVLGQAAVGMLFFEEQFVEDGLRDARIPDQQLFGKPMSWGSCGRYVVRNLEGAGCLFPYHAWYKRALMWFEDVDKCTCHYQGSVPSIDALLDNGASQLQMKVDTWPKNGQRPHSMSDLKQGLGGETPHFFIWLRETGMLWPKYSGHAGKLFPDSNAYGAHGENDRKEPQGVFKDFFGRPWDKLYVFHVPEIINDCNGPKDLWSADSAIGGENHDQFKVRHQWTCCWKEKMPGEDPWASRSSPYACLNWSDNVINGFTWDTLIGPRANLAGCTSVVFIQSCTTSFINGGVNHAKILGSTDNGRTWDHEIGNDSTARVVLPWAIDQRDVRIAWVYTGRPQGSRFWCVDEVGLWTKPPRTHDASVSEVKCPTGVVNANVTVVPSGFVWNFGAVDESVLVTFTIDTIYEQSCWVEVPARSYEFVEFPAWTSVVGRHVARCSASIANDEVGANDVAALEFQVAEDTWVKVYPVFGGSGMDHGAGLAAVDSNNIYCVPGQNTWHAKYIVPEDRWYNCASTIKSFGTGGGLAYPGTGCYTYALRGGNTKTFYRYDLINDVWDTLNRTPERIYRGGALVYGGGGHFYAFRGNGKTDFFIYNAATGLWGWCQQAPGPIRIGGSLVWDCDSFLYALQGNGERNFWRYRVHGGTWSSLAQTPEDVAAVAEGGALAYDSLSRKIYAFFGNRTRSFYAYDIAGDTWEARESVPYRVTNGGCLAYCNHSIYGGVGKGRNDDFWRYIPPAGGLPEKAGWQGEPVEPAVSQSVTVAGPKAQRLDPGEQLTYDPSDKFTPKYSPTGLWIAYTAYDSVRDCIGLYRIPANGGLAQALSTDSLTYEDPEWANSGAWLVAAADDGLYRLASGMPPLRLAQGIVLGPKVPAGDSWVFYDKWDASDHAHNVHRVRPDGSGDTCLTPDADEHLEPMPINDSDFACIGLRDGIHQVRKVTSGQKTWLTADDMLNTDLNMSPDRQWLTYAKLDESGFWQVYKMRVDGTEESRITDATCDCRTPVFSPNGQYIAYTKWPVDSTGLSEFSQVCYKDVVNPVAEAALHEANAERENPCWSPDCQYIVYEQTVEPPTLAPMKEKYKQIGRARTRIKHLAGVEELGGLPKAFALDQNRPNPFGRTTTIRYALPVPSLTELNIYDVTGRTVARLVQSKQKPGYYSVVWKGTDIRGRSVAAGTYFYVLKSNGKIAQKRMLLVR